MALQLRRGSNTARASTVFAAGEPVWTTDTNQLYIGNGIDPGGVLVAGGGGGSTNTFVNATIDTELSIGTGTYRMLLGQSPVPYDNQFYITGNNEVNDKLFIDNFNFVQFNSELEVASTASFAGSVYIGTGTSRIYENTEVGNRFSIYSNNNMEINGEGISMYPHSGGVSIDGNLTVNQTASAAAASVNTELSIGTGTYRMLLGQSGSGFDNQFYITGNSEVNDRLYFDNFNLVQINSQLQVESTATFNGSVAVNNTLTVQAAFMGLNTGTNWRDFGYGNMPYNANNMKIELPNNGSSLFFAFKNPGGALRNIGFSRQGHIVLQQGGIFNGTPNGVSLQSLDGGQAFVGVSTNTNGITYSSRVGANTSTGVFQTVQNSSGVNFSTLLNYSGTFSVPRDLSVTTTATVATLKFGDGTTMTTAASGGVSTSTYYNLTATNELRVGAEDGQGQLKIYRDGTNSHVIGNTDPGTDYLSINNQRWIFLNPTSPTGEPGDTSAVIINEENPTYSVLRVNNITPVSTYTNIAINGNIDGAEGFTANMTGFRAGWYGGNSGYSFKNDSGQDTGMFSWGDGNLRLRSNGSDIVQITDAGMNVNRIDASQIYANATTQDLSLTAAYNGAGSGAGGSVNIFSAGGSQAAANVEILGDLVKIKSSDGTVEVATFDPFGITSTINSTLTIAQASIGLNNDARAFGNGYYPVNANNMKIENPNNGAGFNFAMKTGSGAERNVGISRTGNVVLANGVLGNGFPNGVGLSSQDGGAVNLNAVFDAGEGLSPASIISLSTQTGITLNTSVYDYATDTGVNYDAILGLDGVFTVPGNIDGPEGSVASMTGFRAGLYGGTSGFAFKADTDTGMFSWGGGDLRFKNNNVDTAIANSEIWTFNQSILVQNTATVTALRFGTETAITSRAELIGPTGATGPTGPQGPAGQSASIYDYRANTGATSGDPGSGFVIWNNATQASATELVFSHINDNGDDIEYLLGFLATGDSIRLQDQTNSENNQVWTITAPVTVTTGSYVTVPVSFVSGTHSFSNNNTLGVIIRTAGVTGPTGSTGATGPTGPAGNVGPTGGYSGTERVFALGNTSGTLSVDATSATIFTMTLTGNLTMNAMTNVVTGSNATFVIIQDGTGGRTLTSSWKFAGGAKTLTTSATATDMISVFYDGSTYYASLSRGFV